MIESGSQKSPVKRDASLDSLRGVLVLLVLVLHAEITSGVGRESVVGYLNMMVGPILMPAFFVLSGILGRNALGRGWADFVKGNLLRLLWPYFMWGLIYVFVICVVEQKFELTWHTFWLLLTRPAMLGPIWYLAYLAAFFFLARCLRLVPAWVTMLVLACLTTVSSVSNVFQSDALIHAASFFAGLALSRCGRVMGWIESRAGGRAALPVTLCVLAVTPYFAGDDLRDNGTYVVWIVLASVVVVAGAQRLHMMFGSHFTTKLGVESLVFYLTHWPIMLLVLRVNNELHMVRPSVAFWLAVALSLAIGGITVLLMRKLPILRAMFEPPTVIVAGLRPRETASAPQSNFRTESI